MSEFPSKKLTERTRAVELAVTPRRTTPFTHAPALGTSQETAGPLTAWIVNVRRLVFGGTVFPMLATFLASWLSEASMPAVVLPPLMRGACAGNGKRASPAIGS